MHLRSQRRSGGKVSKRMALWQLPDEVVMYIFKGLHIKDLLKMRSVSFYRSLYIESHFTIYSFLLLHESVI